MVNRESLGNRARRASGRLCLGSAVTLAEGALGTAVTSREALCKEGPAEVCGTRSFLKIIPAAAAFFLADAG